MNPQELQHQKFLEKEARAANYAATGLIKCIDNMLHMIIIFNCVLIGSVAVFGWLTLKSLKIM